MKEEEWFESNTGEQREYQSNLSNVEERYINYSFIWAQVPVAFQEKYSSEGGGALTFIKVYS